jgi:hypothetical protein
MRCVECALGASCVVREWFSDDAFFDWPMCQEHLFAFRRAHEARLDFEVMPLALT